MDCFLDFCLACDKQTMDGLYCSQVCRLADLEKAGSPGSTTPTSRSSLEQEGWPSSRGMGFTLPPGFDFHTPKTNTQHGSSTAPRERLLSPSSSRSSLTSSSSSSSSTTSTQTNQTMSEQAQHELNDYVSSFDAIREMKRRSLSSISSH